jgi:hypothetical protein
MITICLERTSQADLKTNAKIRIRSKAFLIHPIPTRASAIVVRTENTLAWLPRVKSCACVLKLSIFPNTYEFDEVDPASPMYAVRHQYPGAWEEYAQIMPK